MVCVRGRNTVSWTRHLVLLYDISKTGQLMLKQSGFINKHYRWKHIFDLGVNCFFKGLGKSTRSPCSATTTLYSIKFEKILQNL